MSYDTISRRRFVASAGLSSLAGIAGCTGNLVGSNNSSQESSFPDTYNIGTSSPASPIWEYAAWPAFQSQVENEFGTTTNRKVFRGFTPLVGALVRGDVQLGYLSLSSIIKARNQGLPVVAPLGYTQQYQFPLITSPEISSWGDLEGRSIAVHGPAATSTATAKAMVSEELGSVDAVDFQNILGTPNRLSALQSGEVDAAAVFISGALQAEKDGYANILANTWEYDTISDQVTVLWGMIETDVEEKPGMVETTVDQLKESYSWLYETEVETVVDMALETDIFPDFDRDVWIETFKQVREHTLWRRDGTVPESQFEKAQDTLVETGLITEEERVSRDELIYDDYI